MRRLIAVVVALFALTLVGSPLALAQEATPATEGVGLPPGVAFTPLAQAVVAELPQAPADVFFARFTFESGATFPLDPTDPSLALVAVESGTMTFRAVTDVQVTRVAVAGTPVAGEVAVGGVETQLGPGDSALFPPFVAGEIRNVGAVPVVLLAAVIEPVGAADAATPTAATPGTEGTPLADEGAPAGFSFQGLTFGQAD